jgi:hypothetical protein
MRGDGSGSTTRQIQPARLKDQFCGCLVGQRPGDALAFPVEACLPRAIRTYVVKILRKSLASSWGRQPYVMVTRRTGHE